MFNYPGNIHIHSCYSDGSGSIDEISAAAAEAGLSYVVITDHETLAGLSEEAIKYGVLVLVGTEINRSHSHYLAVGLDQPVEPDEDNPQRVIEKVRENGGLGYLAHPLEKGSTYLQKGKAYPWLHWPVFGFDGLELWNYTSHWRGLGRSVSRAIYQFLFNRKAAVNTPPPELIKLWDCYGLAGYRVTAIGSSDAHSSILQVGPIKIKIFSYRFIFNTINTYLVLKEPLSGEFKEAKQQVIAALREGRCYISFDSLFPGKNFKFNVKNGNNRIEMGEVAGYVDNMCLYARSPLPGSLMRLVRNGVLIKTIYSNYMEFNLTEPGMYRVEIFYRPRFGSPRPWIYSNPIYLKPIR